MQIKRTFVRNILGNLARRNPERLWIQFTIAMLIICILLSAIHFVGKSIITRSAAAADIIKESNVQIVTSQEILILAEATMSDRPTNLQSISKMIKQFETDHMMIRSSNLWSEALEQHYFDGPDSLHTLVDEYIALANQFKQADISQQRHLFTRLSTHLGRSGLKDGLVKASSLLEHEAYLEINKLTQLHRSLLLASIVVLILTFQFIITPAHHAIKSSVRKLRRQGDDLRKSESDMKTANTKLEYLINHDALTGLPNRGCLTSYLTGAIQSGGATDLGVLFIGLDGFKSLNDTAGHEFGDAVLKVVANILHSCVDDHHIVARVGGDEFVLVTDEPPKVLVDRVKASVAEPIKIMERRFQINLSIGYLEITSEHCEPHGILADAGLALQYAKNEGPKRVQLFKKELRDEIGTMQQLQLELSDAIKNGEFEPWFQPQIRLADGMLHGAEVLARWRHPTRGLLTPDKFLPAAERAGLMIYLDHAIWRAAMQHAQAWQQAAIWHPCISLNAAPDTIADPNLIERFLHELQRTGLDVDQVIIEVLETTLIDGAEDMAAINIDSLAECGIALELDDFGTGYASLSKLTQLPLSGLKLDRSLVAPLPDQSADSIVRAILALAAELGLHVIAEGVEEQQQAEHLLSRGCAIVQGYGYARPMPPQEFERWLIINAKQQIRIGHEQLTVAKQA